MPQNNMPTNPTEEVELYAVACVHCGKTTFKFSKNMFGEFGDGYDNVELECPCCNKITIFMNRGATGIIQAKQIN
jgi:ssDNA-binding Zn-finger/Zn-ribbon topoisomerase 1